MFIRNPFNWQLRFSTIPSEFRECLTYEEQIMWLYYHIKSITETSGNVNYEALINKPSINGVLLLGNKTLDELNIQSKLYAGEGISINGNVISATGGGSGGTTNYEDLSNKPSINGITLVGDKTFEDLGLNLPTKKVYKDITTDSNVEIADNVLFDLTSTSVGSNIPNWQSATDTKTFSFKASVFPSLTFKVYGRCSNVMWFITDGNPFYSIGSKILEEKSATNLNYTGDFVRMTVPTIGSGDYYITFQFTSVSFDTPLIEFESEEIDLDTIQKLSTDIILKDNENPNLQQGLYYTGEHGIFYHSISEANLVFGFNDIIYYDIGTNNVAISDALKTYIRDFATNEWSITQSTDIENELTDTRSKIPTSHAVYEAIQNISPTPTGDIFYTELNEEITLNADGTTTPVLEEGYYYLGNYNIKYYDRNNNLVTNTDFKDSLFYYNESGQELKRTSVNSKNSNQFECRLQYLTTYWNIVLDDQYKYVKNTTNSLSFLSNSIPATGDDNDVANINATRNYFVAKSSISTAISSTSTNSEVAGAKAVYDIINSPSICQLTNSARIACSTPQQWANNTLALDVEKISSSDFTFSTTNHDVTVGSRPRLVEVSFSCNVDTLSQANYNFRIKVEKSGGTSAIYCQTAFKTVSGLDVGNLSNSTIIEVEAGDKISLCYTSNTAGANFYAGTDATLTIKTLANNINA